MKHKYILILLSLLFSFQLYAQQQKSNYETIKKDLTFLASDSLKGRYPGTVEDSVAAAYISNELINAGFLPLVGNSPMLPFEFTLHRAVKRGATLSAGERAFIEEADFKVHPLSDTGDYTAFAVKVEKEDRYKNQLNLKDKIGVVEIGDDSLMFVITPLKEMGLIAILYYNGDSLSAPLNARVNDAGIPVVQITSATAKSILNMSDRKIYLKTAVDIVKGKSYNIVAVNNRSDRKPFVLIGAHYDHLGFGESGSMVKNSFKIHNGADDNASGVAAMLESARLLAKSEKRVVVSAFGAEERGLIGSRILADTLETLGLLPNLMLNMDMVGRLNDNKLQVGGVGTFKGADSIVKKVNNLHNFTITTTLDGYGASDHASFYRKGVPVIYLTTGVHREYHTPDDDIGLINFNGIAKVTDFVTGIITDMLDSEFIPEYIKVDAPSSPGRQSFKVTLGLIPDFTYEKGDGFRIGAVTEGRAASKGGLKEGDIITLMRGKKINNIYDYMGALGELKPGESVQIELIRGGEKIILTLNL